MTYEYECTECGNSWEEDGRSVEDATSICSRCYAPPHRVIYTTSFQLKGRKLEKKDGYWYFAQ